MKYREYSACGQWRQQRCGLSLSSLWQVVIIKLLLFVITQWRQDWSSASAVNHTIVTDRTIRQPGFDISRHTWSLINRFGTGQGPCHANLHKWGLTQSPSRDCGKRQTMNHTADTCPLTQFGGWLNQLHEADDGAVIWLESTATAALAK